MALEVACPAFQKSINVPIATRHGCAALWTRRQDAEVSTGRPAAFHSG
jgi:hypothetical protein